MDQDRTRRAVVAAMGIAGASAAAGCALLGGGDKPKKEAAIREPIIIAHRGASGERPEHTMAAYRLAIAQGADYIEPDLVPTKDGVLVCRHENDISGTTDVAAHPEFASRRATKVVDGVPVTGWFTEDFTLAELKTLRCRERLPQVRPANTAYDGQETIPTFEEVLDLAIAERARLNRVIGVYPETKHPTYFDALGLSHDKPLLAALRARDYGTREAPIFVQSFEVDNLRRIAGQADVKCVQLASAQGGPFDRPGVTYESMMSDAGLTRISTYAGAIGVEKTMLLPRDADGRSIAPSPLIARAHEAGLKVHAWTFRAENQFLPLELRRGDAPSAHGDMPAELKMLFARGLDGAFCDFPAIGVAARG